MEQLKRRALAMLAIVRAVFDAVRGRQVGPVLQWDWCWEMPAQTTGTETFNVPADGMVASMSHGVQLKNTNVNLDTLAWIRRIEYDGRVIYQNSSGVAAFGRGISFCTNSHSSDFRTPYQRVGYQRRFIVRQGGVFTVTWDAAGSGAGNNYRGQIAFEQYGIPSEVNESINAGRYYQGG